MSRIFRNREDAGVQLAARLSRYTRDPNVIVLGLPRGGVPVAYQVARKLEVPLDVFVVRKLGVPGQKELAMGAIASGGVRVLNPEVVSELRIDDAEIARVAGQEEIELERQDRAYRGGVPFPALAGRIVIVIDDGLATGSTMRAAVKELRQMHPSRIVVAVPVAAADTYRSLTGKADEVVSVCTPESFQAVSAWYRDFAQITDEEVRALLANS
ncbi:MAG TPA: phosphoribosyltransferase [Bryobacteraceae bacterium]|nr:phosphoribosyltransferase [Bryobacteraceae bacterium]